MARPKEVWLKAWLHGYSVPVVQSRLCRISILIGFDFDPTSRCAAGKTVPRLLMVSTALQYLIKMDRS
jgi:hypothetical protein